MAPTPSWVKDLKPSGPQGYELLKAERAKSALNTQRLTHVIHGKEELARRDRILEILESEKVFDKSQNYFAGRIERLERSLAKAKRMYQLSVKHGWSRDEFLVANDLLGEGTPYRLHDAMYMMTLRDQGTPEQHELFLKKSENYEYMGCYAQTELGHGSNVRGLETTATWNPGDKTFTLHSPHLTASKWWIGSLGRIANHAVVMAQLVIAGKSYGPHPFVVQIRDLQTHQPLDNIHVGDVGPKMGFSTMDNGFLLFNKVKIPHNHMLAKFSRVDPITNTYQRPTSPSLVYGTLTFIRCQIVQDAGAVLARGVTVAIRYCAIRRQFTDRDAPPTDTAETQVLNYKTVQIRLLTALAATYALHFTGKGMRAMWDASQAKSVPKPKSASIASAGPEETSASTDAMADLHATSCGLKSIASDIAAQGLETARRACGGHGYSSFAGIGTMYTDYVPTATWEGDNYMLTQQVARYLLKSARAVLAGDAPANDTMQVLTDYHRKQETGAAFDILGDDGAIVAAFAWRAAHLTFAVLRRRDVEKMAWNDLLVDFYRLSKAHSQYLVVKNFHATLHDHGTKAALGRTGLDIMEKLFRLWSLHTLDEESSEFFTSAACTVRQIELTRGTAVTSLLEEVRPHAVALVDAWDIPDWQLDSSLGRYDGKVYEDMFYRASELNPLNAFTVDPYPYSDVMFKRDGKVPGSKL